MALKWSRCLFCFLFQYFYQVPLAFLVFLHQAIHIQGAFAACQGYFNDCRIGRCGGHLILILAIAIEVTDLLLNGFVFL